jgi:hypothetical protein
MYDAIADRGTGSLEACCDYHSTVVPCPTHPLVFACVRAWVDHRPLVLTPDTIWLGLAQGFAAHVNAHSEELRSRLVSHEGKMELVVDGDALGFVRGSPENPWPLAFSAFGEQIRAASKGGYDLVVARFSTTGPVELAAQEVVLMDAFQSYFEYSMMMGCGLPEVTLVGETADWELLAEKARAFSRYGLEEWALALEPILGQLVATSRGEVDRGFWRDLVHYHEEEGGYGGPRQLVDGWLTTLVPFTDDGRMAPIGSPRSLYRFASGLSTAPLTERSKHGERKLDLVAGYVGLEQSADLALRPKLGWAVRRSKRPA